MGVTHHRTLAALSHRHGGALALAGAVFGLGFVTGAVLSSALPPQNATTFDTARAAAALRALGGDTPMIRTAVRRAPAIESWLNWLVQELARPRAVPRTPPWRIVANAAIGA